MKRFVCGLDLGTSNLKAALLDEAGEAAVVVTAPPPPAGEGGAELAAEEICRTAAGLVRECFSRSGIASRDVAALAVASQRASLVAVAADGRPLIALSWQDTRGGTAAAELARAVGPERLHRLTGLPPAPLWSSARIAWLRGERPELFRRTTRFVLLHDFLLRRLGAADYFADPSNASLTGLLDLERLVWSEEILGPLGVAEAQLPLLVTAGREVGRLDAAGAAATGLLPGTPLIAGGGDQQCAALGLGATEPGQAVLCLGTAAVLSCPVSRPILAAGGIFCTAHALPDRWVVEGIHNAFGSSLRWVADLLGLRSPEELASLAAAGAAGVSFLPFLAGTGTPDFDGSARGLLAGLGLGHGRAEIARAVYEGVALEMRRVIEAVDVHVPVRDLRVTGGGSSQDLLLRILAALGGRELRLGGCRDATLRGAAILAWTGAGRFPGVAEAAAACAARATETLAPDPEDADRERAYAAYLCLLGAVRRPATGSAQ